MTVAWLPFTEKPGTLLLAPLGTDPPDHVAHKGVFHGTWPPSWIDVLQDGALTNPEDCSATRSVPFVRVAQIFDLTELERLGHEGWWWSFGPAVAARLGRLVGSAEVRMMIGWQSDDARDRVLARQAVLREDGFLLLEQPYKAPEPALRWWQRLQWWRRPVRVAEQHPPFTVYRAGLR